jgi:hypothetical protein
MPAGLPHVTSGRGAGVGLGATGKLAIEFGAERPAVREPQLGARRDEAEVGRRRRAVDDETRPRQCLEGSGQ